MSVPGVPTNAFCPAAPAPVVLATISAEISTNELQQRLGKLVLGSGKSRRQMENRLRLRRRLLRIDTDTSLLSLTDAAKKETNQPEKGTANPMRHAKPARANSFPMSSSAMPVGNNRRLDDGEEDDDDGEDGENDDDEQAEDDEEDEDDDDADEADDEAARSLEGAAIIPRAKGDKCDQSQVVKLLFSSSDPCGRPPTVWFDYPSHLQVTRALPVSFSSSSSSMSDQRILTVPASHCEVFFKTHWERNCVKNAFAVAGLKRTRKRWSGWHIAWAKHMPRDKFKLLRDNQVFSHFPDPWIVGRKDRLMKTLTNYKRRFGASYAFFPEGFTLPDQLDTFKRASSSQASSSSSLWILKPPASACGRGIRVVTAKDVDAFLTNKNNKEKKYVIQKYVSNPLLVDGVKFDLRIYVLVTSMDPLRIYLFQEGLTRFCTTPFSLKNIKNRFAHLTNYSVNKQNEKFVENPCAENENIGNKWSMSALFEHLQKTGLVHDIEALRQQIKDVIRKTLICAEAHLTPLMHQFVKKAQNVKCYELFGFDMMLDDNAKPWLVEVNVSPSLMAASPLDKKIKGLLLSDIFHLVGVPVARDTLPVDAIPVEFQMPQESSTIGESSTTASANTSTARPIAINKQLHEIVLDPKVVVFEKKHIELFSTNDWQLIYDMEDEMDRLGHFERIFPCDSFVETATYAPFFPCARYGNALCVKWIETKRRAREQKEKTKAKSSAGGAGKAKPVVAAGREDGSGSAREHFRPQGGAAGLVRSKTLVRSAPPTPAPPSVVAAPGARRLIAQAASR